MEPLFLEVVVLLLLLLRVLLSGAGLAITSPTSSSGEKCPSSRPGKPVMFLHRVNVELLAELLRMAWDLAVAGGLVITLPLLLPPLRLKRDGAEFSGRRRI